MRLSQDNLRYCVAKKICLDCYEEGNDKPAVELQKRRSHNVPCCRKHLNAYKSKLNRVNARKYARTAERKKQTGHCTYNGCRNKLIPKELLPPWIDESTCGMHSRFKACRVNRHTLLRLIFEHCLTPEEREGMTAQNVVYRSGDGLVWFSARKAHIYVTTCFSARALLKLHKELRYTDSKPQSHRTARL